MRNAFNKFKLCCCPAFLAGVLAAPHAAAQIDESVHTLDFKEGQSEFDVKAGTVKQRGEDRLSEGTIALGHGVTSYWLTKISAEYKRQSPDGTTLDAIEWENRFRLTPAGRYWLDAGLLTEIEWAKKRDEGYRVKFGPLLQKQFDKIQLNANLLFERHLSETPSRETEMSYQVQAKYEWKENFQFGLQGFGELGPWDDWAPREEQSHRFGPAIFGKTSLGKEHKIEYNAAYLADASSRARSHGFKLQVKYLF